VSSIKLGKYRHFKGGEYEVIGVARDSETMQEMVVYRALYGGRELWVRSREMFSEIVQKEGAAVPRFEFVGEMD
jgi:cyclomaltodextrinase / maltogenic alpha-amylase / neopullulanase